MKKISEMRYRVPGQRGSDKTNVAFLYNEEDGFIYRQNNNDAPYKEFSAASIKEHHADFQMDQVKPAMKAVIEFCINL